MSRIKIIKKKVAVVSTILVFKPEEMTRRDYMDYEEFCKKYWDGKVSNENYYVLCMNEEQKALYEEERQRLLKLWENSGHPKFWEMQRATWAAAPKKSKEQQERQKEDIIFVLSSWYDNDDD